MPAPLDLVIFYAELGRPYLPLIQTCTATAKKAMPHIRTVLLTPTPSKQLEQCFDKMVDLSPDMTTTHETVCIDRVRATVSWQAMTHNRTIFSDPDIEFNREVEFGGFDIGVLWRPRYPAQPINTGLVLAEPGQTEFWRHYGAIAVNLPKVLHSWWCDQLAYTVMVGTLHKAGDTVMAHGSRVKLFDMHSHCTAREKSTSDNPWAWHDKGKRKWEAAA